ncbi:hypothetical protein ACOMHN_026547 [Nucella lapillus]
MRLLAHFPDLQAYADGRDIRLAFACDLNATLKEAYNRESWDDEGVHLAKAAKLVRRDMFLLKSKFTGSFSESSQLSSVPETLLALMEMILDGPSLGNSGRGRQQASLTLAQLASFNAVKRARTNTATIKHSNERETPLPVYVGLAIHAQTRKKALVDNMFTLGLSVSYNRVLEMSTELASRACSQFHSDGVVCPMKLRSGLFTTAAIDNLDHNPSSTTAKDAFHGTAISLFQHPTDTIAGEERTCVNADYQPSKKLSVPDLPEFYCSVPPFALKLPVEPPDQNVHAADDTDHYVKANETEIRWLQAVETVTDSLTEAQVAEFREAFILLTREGQGPVTTGKLGRLLRLLGLNPGEKELHDMIAQIDPKGKGTVDFTEFLKMMTKRNKHSESEEQLREAFKVFDKDGDGYLSVSEFRHVMTNLGERLTPEEVEDMVRQVDHLEEGRVSCEEFVKLVTS